MSNLGFGVMLNMLMDNRETVESIKSSVGNKITDIKLSEDKLFLWFADKQEGYNARLEIWDDGQSCCESRYMRTDDKLTDFIGSDFVSAETRGAPSVPDQFEEHEVQFLLITTSLGVFTVETHNEHNGYYGGFAIRAKLFER